MLRDCLDPWLQSLRVDWTEQCNVFNEMVCQFREGCEADLNQFVLSHLHVNMPHLLSRAEVPVWVRADGTPASTHGRADIVCIDNQQVVVLELKRHPLAACRDDVEGLAADAQLHRGDLTLMGMAELRRLNTAALAARARSIEDRLFVLHAVNNGGIKALWDTRRVLQFGNRVHVIRTGRSVVDAALAQAEHYATSVRERGFHPAARLPMDIERVFSAAICVFGETMVCEWNTSS
jgi:hypothetical protein